MSSRSRSRSRSPERRKSPRRKMSPAKVSDWNRCCGMLDISRKDASVKGSAAHTKVLQCFRQIQADRREQLESYHAFHASHPNWLEEQKERSIRMKAEQEAMRLAKLEKEYALERHIRATDPFEWVRDRRVFLPEDKH